MYGFAIFVFFIKFSLNWLVSPPPPYFNANAFSIFSSMIYKSFLLSNKLNLISFDYSN